jgi:hypothetical protein
MLTVTMLLLSFTLSALAVVGAVGWLGRTGSPLVLVAAVLLALALTGLVLGRLLAMLPERPRAMRHPSATWVAPGIVAVALLVPLGLPTIEHPPVRPGGSRIGTVRGFLGAVVDNDGVTACRYLTARARQEYADHSCQGSFGALQLRLGGRAATSDAQLDRLHYAAHGRTVTVGGKRLGLQWATPGERSEFLAPPTPWRVASGVGHLA